MKQLLFFILLTTIAQGMQQMPRTTAIIFYREKNRQEFFPSLTVPSEGDWYTVNNCFRELLNLEFYPSSAQGQKITFADAKRYCDFATKYRDVPDGADWFCPEYQAAIKRFTNLVMFATFYPDGSGSERFGPPTAKQKQVILHAYSKVTQNIVDMRAILNMPVQDFTTVAHRFEQIVAALRAFKANPTQHYKSETD